MGADRMKTTGIAVASLLAGWLLMAWVHAGNPAVILGGIVVSALGLVVRLRVLAPWSNIVAWTAAVVTLYLAGRPPQTGVGPAVLITLGLLGIVIGLHVPPREGGIESMLIALTWWTGAALLVGLVTWWPVILLESQRIGVLDPATSVGVAVRLVGMLVVLALGILMVSALRSRAAGRLGEENGPGDPDGATEA